MKTSEKIVIVILSIITVICIAVIFSYFRRENSNPVSIGTNINYSAGEYTNNEEKETKRIINVKQKLYYDTGKESKLLRCGMMDGKITSNVKSTEIPKENNQSNFEGEYGYQFGIGNTIEVCIENKWIIFEAESKEFTIKVYDKSPETNTKLNKILEESETEKYDYNIYGFQVNVNIIIDGEEVSLRSALLEDKITMDEIIEKAERDIPNAIVLKDGGSKEYHYELYTIIKYNTLDGKRDVYFTMPNVIID